MSFDHKFLAPLDLMDVDAIKFHAAPSKVTRATRMGRCRICQKDLKASNAYLHADPARGCEPKGLMRFIAGHKKYNIIFSDVSLIIKDYRDGAPSSADPSRMRNLDYYRAIVELHEAGLKIVRVADEIWAPQWLFELANETKVKPAELFHEIARQLRTGERQSA